MRGSFFGRFAFMGKSVLGKFNVLFKSSNLGIILRSFPRDSGRRDSFVRRAPRYSRSLPVPMRTPFLEQTTNGTIQVRASQPLPLGSEPGILFCARESKFWVPGGAVAT